MATLRERPYSQFNYLVDLGTGDTDSAQAGFSEVSGLGMEITVAEYRNGNEKDNAPRKINAMYKVPDVTLKRGVIGVLDFYEWLDQVRNGAQEESLRTVTVQLLSEDRSAVALTWKLTGARIMKYTGPTLNGTGTEVAVEEITLACERIEVE
jgi:phage tail-like protein